MYQIHGFILINLGLICLYILDLKNVNQFLIVRDCFSIGMYGVNSLTLFYIYRKFMLNRDINIWLKLLSYLRMELFIFTSLFFITVIIDLLDNIINDFDILYVINIIYITFMHSRFKKLYHELIYDESIIPVYLRYENQQNQQNLQNNQIYPASNSNPDQVYLIPIGTNVPNGQSGQSDRMIRKVKAVIESQNECSICLQKIGLDDEYGILSCRHEYHYSCIQAWVSQNTEIFCPLCGSK